MTYLSIIEKLKILFNTLLDFKFILVFAILLLIFTLLYVIKKLNGKKYMLCMFLSFVLVFGISIISNYEVLSNTFDNFATIVFGNIYFPSIYAYIGVLVISFISLIVSVFNINIKKIYKVINSIMFIVNNVLFVIILNIIAKNKIDIFSVNSLYTNTNLVAILELSMGLFILWILSLIATYTTNMICDRLSYKKVYNTELEEKSIFNPVLEVSDIVTNGCENNDTDAVLVEGIAANKEETTASENELIMKNDQYLISEEVKINSMIEDNNMTENNISVIEETQDVNCDIKDNVTFNDLLNGCIPVMYYDNNVKEEEYSLIDPQVIYENKYNEAKNENVIFNDNYVSLDTDVTFEKENILSNSTDVIFENNINEEIELSVEEKTLRDKERVKEERLVINTISLNDLIDDDDVKVSELEIENEVIDNNNNAILVKEEKQDLSGYTLDDYKKMIKMLNELKKHSDSTNINVDDAVAISLISNYSIDDCIKFKNMLESNLV